MSEFDFLKEFGKNLDREQPHDYSDADWKSIESSLDAQDLAQKRDHGFMAWGLPLAVLVGFLLLGGALWKSNQKTALLQEDLLRLQAVIALKSTTITTKVTSIDSIITVMKYDTIYRTIVMTREIRDKKILSSNTSVVNQTNVSNNFLEKMENEVVFHEKTPINEEKEVKNANLAIKEPANNIAFEEHKANAEKNEMTPNQTTFWPVNQQNNENKNNYETPKAVSNRSNLVKNISIAMLPIRPLKPIKYNQIVKIHDLGLVMQVEPLKHRQEDLIKRIKPAKNAEIGLRTGAIFPYNENAKSHPGLNIGINSGFKLGKHLRLIVGADVGQVDFSLHTNDLTQIPIPIPSPPTPDDVLKSVQVEQPILDFSLGLRYDFRLNKTIRPYFSTTWLIQSTFEQGLKYEYFNPITEDESSIRRSGNDHYSYANGLQIGSGLDWHFRKHWSLGIEGVFQKQFSKEMPLLEQRFTLRTGVKYHF
jgi:hypothetical protein